MVLMTIERDLHWCWFFWIEINEFKKKSKFTLLCPHEGPRKREEKKLPQLAHVERVQMT